jgi:hypothetical protein
MPYIADITREILDADVSSLSEKIETAGELNYVITRLVAGYARDGGVTYSNLNAVIGALECAKLELYRRLAAPYEDGKIKANGDVPEYK